jgi:hypothetical protein
VGPFGQLGLLPPSGRVFLPHHNQIASYARAATVSSTNLAGRFAAGCCMGPPRQGTSPPRESDPADRIGRGRDPRARSKSVELGVHAPIAVVVAGAMDGLPRAINRAPRPFLLTSSSSPPSLLPAGERAQRKPPLIRRRRPRLRIGSGACTELARNHPWCLRAESSTARPIVVRRRGRNAVKPPRVVVSSPVCPILGKFTSHGFAKILSVFSIRRIGDSSVMALDCGIRPWRCH